MGRWKVGLVALALVAGCNGASAASDGGSAPDAQTADAGGGGDAGSSLDAGLDGGTPTAGSAKVGGLVGGIGLRAKDALTEVDRLSSYDRMVTISETENACADLQAGIGHQDREELRITLRNLTPSLDARPLTVGTYAVTMSTTTPGLTARVEFDGTDGVCSSGTLKEADGGTVTVTAAGVPPAGAWRGTFTAEFPDGSFTGQFDAPLCTGPAPNVTTCEP